MTATKTQPLPTTWHWSQDVQLSTPARRRFARDTASMATTTELPVIGRAGTRERVRAGDATFGGGEVR